MGVALTDRRRTSRLGSTLELMPEASDLRVVAGAGGALALMSARYWTTVVPRAQRQVQRWHDRARAIPNPDLRAIALAKLREERFNVQTAPTFATLAPRDQRSNVVEAIVALQVIYDYLDGVTEQPVAEQLRNGRQLFLALGDAVSPSREAREDYYRYHPHSDDGGYLQALVDTTRGAVAKLPAGPAVGELMGVVASRCGEAQARAHAVQCDGLEQLERWASEHAEHEQVSWRESLAGSASAVISMHALIAAGADRRTTRAQAARLETFHRSTCALATILDGLADRVHDERRDGARIGYLRYFPDGESLSVELTGIARRAADTARGVPRAGHHLMTLAGVVAYYTSALGAGESSSKALVAPLHRELRPLIAPTLMFMRAWRRAKRLRERSGPSSHR